VAEPLITTRDDRYLRLLMLLLISAAFFEGYDSSILALLLPNIQNTFHASEALLGVTRIPIELGLFVAFFFTRLSDRFGRRPLLLWSVVGYTVFTALTALSWNIWSFTLFQFASRIFLGAEYAVGVTMIVEEFPAARRGRALGTLLTFSALGTIVEARQNSERFGVVAIASGGAPFTTFVQEAAARGADTYVTGEISMYTRMYAKERKVNLVAGSHYATETFGVRALAQLVEARFGIAWTFVPESSDVY